MIEDPLFAGTLPPDGHLDDPMIDSDDPPSVDFDQPYRGELGFGRWGRYRRPHPITGEIMEFTRCSTVAAAVQSTFALDRWQRGRLIKGLAGRPDLVELAQGIEVDDMRALEKISERAQESAGVHNGADKGTALHRFAELIDGGRVLPRAISEVNRNDLGAYRDALDRNGLIALPELMERVVWVDDLEVCGRLDRIYQITTADGEILFVVGDLKTSQHDPIKYSAVSVAVQLSIYSRARFFEVGNGTGLWEPPPVPVDQDLGLVIHFPSGSARAQVFEVDLGLGWELAGMAMRIRDLNSARGRSRLVRPYRRR